MSKSSRSFLVLAALLAPLAALSAQGRSTVSRAQLETATATAAAAPSLTRDGLRTFLATDDARKAAGALGANSADLAAYVATMDQAALDRFARTQRIGDRDLAGGRDTVVISTTAIIIGLLILILLTD